ncbi:ribosomal-processing cysteine protease Prp [Heyndrickxia camelliae]|uniref:ribosomal-processing cysteine protease Prp n=1 Tax=Heyndrickxia camelliae TaxID=1707093 RepID=UPI003F59E205
MEITRSSTDGKIMSFQSEGHAYYDEPGKDIVCAGVSAVTFGTVNSIEALLGIVPNTQYMKVF